MNFDEIVVKDSPGLCRCCLSEGCYKDLGTEYTWMNENEVYADMLLECFDISISQHTDGPNGSNRLICEVCITRLRDACNFKKQVLDSEKKFVDMLARGEFQTKMIMYQAAPMKTEELLEEPAAEDVEYLEDLDYEDDLPLNQVGQLEASVSDLAGTVKVKGKRGRPKKTSSPVKTEKKPKISKMDAKPQTSKAVAKDIPPSASANKQRRRNLQILFNNTTVVPFKWRSRYMCFFCGEDLPTAGDLRAHTETHRPFSERDRAMKLVKASDSEVKLDVSILNCTICDESFPNLEEIISHLSHKHKLPYNKDVDLSIAAYRLVDLKCLHCDDVYDFFGTLIKHTNSLHPSDCFVCDDCGQKFNKKRDLQSHIRSCHKNAYSCSKCSQSFEFHSDLQSHKANEHVSTCNVCLETFSSTYKRLKHMKLEHDFENLQCGLCFRVLSTKQAFLTHASRCTKNSAKEKQILTKSGRKRPSVKLMRNNIACILNMSTAILFKYYMNKFRCFYCPKDFVESDELRQHTVLEHPLCDTKLKSMKLRHRKEDGVKVDVSTLSCKLCFDHIPDLESLINHLISEHKAKYDRSVPNILQPYKLMKDNYQCPECGEKYRYFGMLLRHIGREHTGNRKVCIYCGKCFRTDPNLRAHISRYHTAAKYHCTYCEAEFSSSNDLQIHLGSKHGVKVAECPECHEKFTSSYRVQRHMIIMHGVGHKCSFCGKLFTKHSFMTSHVRRLHLKEKNVECSVCFEKFFDTQRLKMHMVKHVGERNFHCDLCGKKFLWKKNLRGHMASHIKQGVVGLAQA